MSWTALARREFKEHVRPAAKWSGTLIAAVVLSIVFSAGATIAGAFAVAEAVKDQGANLSPHLHAIIAIGLGLAMGQFVASMVPMNLGIDAIAGERERHTLGTLLATPLSDGSILWAKTVAILGVTGVVAAISGTTIWITATILFGVPGLLWGLLAIPGAVIASSVSGFFTLCFAFIVSARSKTVKDAGQKLSFIVLPVMLPVFLVGPLANAESQWPLLILGGVFATAMLVGAVVLPILAFTGFKRERLLTV